MKAEKPHQTSFSMCLTPGPLDQIVFLLPADPHEVLSCAQGGQGWKWKPRFPFGVELSQLCEHCQSCACSSGVRQGFGNERFLSHSLFPAKPVTSWRWGVPGVDENRRKIAESISAKAAQG